jgi:hypothetical protein
MEHSLSPSAGSETCPHRSRRAENSCLVISCDVSSKNSCFAALDKAPRVSLARNKSLCSTIALAVEVAVVEQDAEDGAFRSRLCSF